MINWIQELLGFYEEIDAGWLEHHNTSRDSINPDDHMLVVQDNAPSHRVKHTQEVIARDRIYLMKWSANSPDLNSIENLWATLKRRLNNRVPRPLTRMAMEEAIQKEWDRLTPLDYEKAIDSMPRRCEVVILAEGGSIDY